jgi:hypothetical protein
MPLTVADLLAELFTAEELRRLALALDRQLALGLPGGEASLARLSFDLAEAARRHGLLRELLQQVLHARPHHSQRVEGLAGGLGWKLDPRRETPLSPQATPRSAPPPTASLLLRLSGTQAQATLLLDGRTAADSGPQELGPPSPALQVGLSRLRTASADRLVLELMSEVLTTSLLRDRVRDVFTQARAHAPLLVRLQAADVEVTHEPSSWRSYPWELLRDPAPPHEPLFHDPRLLRIVRELPGVVRDPLPPAPPTGRLLLITASPPHLPPLAVQEEDRRIAALWGSGVTRLDLPDLRTLKEALETTYDVVHLACHGDPGRLRLGEELDAHILARLLKGRVTSTVWINACSGSAPGGEVRYASFGWDGVAGRLIAAGVPHVIAHAVPVHDQDAIDAAVAWHRSWRSTPDPCQATAAARDALRTSRRDAFGTLTHLARGVG